MTTKDPQTGRTSETAPGRRFHRLWPTAVVVVLWGVTGLLFFRIQSEGEVIRESNQAGLRPNREAVNVVALKLIPAAIFLIFLILVTLFNSVSQPLIILTSVILSLA